MSAIATSPQCDRNSGDAIDFTQLPSLSRILIGPEGDAHVVLHAGRSCLTVYVGGTTVLEGPVDVTFLIEGRVGVGRAPRLMRLAKHLLSPTIQVWDAEARRDQDYHRLRNALVALDGYQAKVSQRDIAAVLFGKDLAEAAWRDGDMSLKQRTRRAIILGRQLSAGDYRRLL
jgi:hypothetical protein